MVVRYIEDCAQLKHEGTYTCQAESGSASMTSPSVTVFVSGNFILKLISVLNCLFYRNIL